jgi:hypothetical protein
VTTCVSDVTELMLRDRLEQFATSAVSGVWPHLQKKQIITDIAARIKDPYQIQQGAQPFCGPAAVIFELVRKQPHRYIDICQQLYEGGYFRGFSRSIVAKEKLRHGGGKIRIAQADWMLMATLRAEANLIVPVHAKTSLLMRNIGGMTKSWEMADWLRELLDYRQTDFKIIHRKDSEAIALNTATANIAAGGTSLLLLNSQILLEGKWLPISFPSHWVTLLAGANIVDPSADRSTVIELPIYSWGRKIKLKATKSNLQQHLWGVVHAR